MAAKIRLKRVGRRGQPSYRVVVLDGRKPRDAKVVADLGHYDPKTNPPTFEVDGDAALKWLLEGAKATKAARDILSMAGVMAAWDAAKRGETVEIEKKNLKPTAKPKKAKADETPAGADEAAEDTAQVEVAAAVDEAPAEATETAPEETSKGDEAPAEPEPEPEEKTVEVSDAAEPEAAPEEAAEAEEAGDAEDEAEEEKA